MRAGWKTITLNDACIQMNGIWKGTKEPLVPAKVLRTTNFSKDCRIKLDDLVIIDVEKKKLDARRLQRGDIIVEKSGGGPKQPVGRVILFDMDDDDYSFCNFTSALRIKDKEQLDFNYLHKYLTYLYFEGETEKYQSNLVGFRNLDFKGYVGIEVPYPSLPEQQRIVEILDKEFAKIDALKANAEKSLQAAKDLFQATLKKELEPKEGWITKTLKEIAEDIGDGLHGTPEYEDNGPCYFINGNNLNDGTIVFSEKTKRVSNEERIKYYIPLNEQTLLVSINGTLGKVAYYRGENIILGKSACYIVLRSGISREYVFHYLASDIFMQYAEKEYTGLTIKNVSLKSMRNFPICFPTSITDQKKIVDVLNILKKRCDTIKQNYQKTLTLCNDLKQSLLHKAFNGEL